MAKKPHSSNYSIPGGEIYNFNYSLLNSNNQPSQAAIEWLFDKKRAKPTSKTIEKKSNSLLNLATRARDLDRLELKNDGTDQEQIVPVNK